MGKRLYVGNLPFSTNADDLRSMFSEYGTVVSADVISDRATGRSRGFGFVELGDESEAEAAVKALDGTSVGGRSLTVNVARERSDERRRF